MLNRKHGCYYQNANNVYNFPDVEGAVGRKFDVYSTFTSMDSTVATHTEHLTASQAGKTLLVAWKPTRTVGLTFADILAGVYNAKLDEWFNYFGSLPGPVVIRWGWEMNGSFMQYNPLYSQTATDSSHVTSPAQYVDVWRYVVNRQRSLGATNIRWYWCANQNDAPGTAANALELFWPGAAYVDIVGYDSYNSLNGRWMTPEETLAGVTNGTQARTYDRVTALHPTAEVWVGETGCVDANDPKDVNPTVYPGHSKSAWLTELFALGNTVLPRLTTICWFDFAGTRNWRFDSSQAALTTFRSEFSRAGTPAEPPAPVVGQPPAWFGYDIPMPEVHPAGRPIAEHIAEHLAFKHWANQIIAKVGGWAALVGNSDGSKPAIRAVSQAVGSALEAVLRVEVVPGAAKRAFAIRATDPTAASPSQVDTFTIDSAGKHEWGDGTGSRETNLSRSAANTLRTDGNLDVGGALTPASLSLPQATVTNVTATPAAPTAAGGVKVFAQGDALRARSSGLNYVLAPPYSAVHNQYTSVDPATATGTTALVVGTLYLMKVAVAEARTLTQVGLNVTTAGAGLVACYAGIYDAGGNLLATSADQATAWATTGEKRVTVPGVAVNAGYYYAAFLVGAGSTTSPTVSMAQGVSNWNLGASVGRSLTNGTGLTALPATVTMGNSGLQSKLLFAALM